MQKISSYMYTCKELLLPSNPDWHTVLVCRTQGFYHSSQPQPKIFYCSGHASVALTHGFEPVKKKLWLWVSEVAFSMRH